MFQKDTTYVWLVKGKRVFSCNSGENMTVFTFLRLILTLLTFTRYISFNLAIPLVRIYLTKIKGLVPIDLCARLFFMTKNKDKVTYHRRMIK